MDKYSIKIRELDCNLKSLYNKQEENNNKICKIISDIEVLKNNCIYLNKELIVLSNVLDRLDNSTNKINISIFKLIIEFIIAIICSLFMTSELGIVMMIIDFICLGFFVFDMSEYISEKEFVNKNKYSDVSTSVSNIKSKKQLNELNKKNLELQLDELEKLNIMLEREIKDISFKLSTATESRNMIIESYVNNNLELNRLLDVSYDSNNEFAPNLYSVSTKNAIEKNN